MKDAYYFSHDSNARHDPKILKLRRVLRSQGYGIFWMIIETLREADNYKLPLSCIEDLAYDFDEPKDIILSVISDFELFQIDENNNFFCSLRLIRSMNLKDATRKKLSEAGKKGRQKQLQGALFGESTARPGHESKESNIKEREKNFKEAVFYFKHLYDSQMLTNFFNYWSQYGENDRKMLFEKEKVFQLSKRLTTWYNKDQQYNRRPQKELPQPKPIINRLDNYEFNKNGKKKDT